MTPDETKRLRELANEAARLSSRIHEILDEIELRWAWENGERGLRLDPRREWPRGGVLMEGER